MQGKHIYIVGIGGIGLSALAQLYTHEGAVVSGSDRSEQPTTELLLSKGITIYIGHDATHVPQDTELMVYSDAVYPDNPERMRAQELGIPQMSYFEALGEVTSVYKTIAVSGSHGKTTTTAMLIDVLEAGGLDPTAIVGSLRTKTKSNFRVGGSTYFVVEADEYLRHFLHFTPHILVITNIDADHLDYYKDLADVQSAFRELVEKIPRSGFLVCDVHDEKVIPVIAGATCTVVDYKKYFDPALPLQTLSLHRINAAAVLAVADILKIDQSLAKGALADFSGTWRRFEYKGKTTKGALVYDDYAHHPTEIQVTLKSIREKFPGKKVIVAFHPHLYSRTKLLFNEFVHALASADDVVLAPIFAAREEKDPTISSALLAERISALGTHAQALDSFEEIATYLLEVGGENSLIVTMGAGDVYKVAEQICTAE